MLEVEMPARSTVTVTVMSNLRRVSAHLAGPCGRSIQQGPFQETLLRSCHLVVDHLIFSFSDLPNLRRVSAHLAGPCGRSLQQGPFQETLLRSCRLVVDPLIFSCSG